MYEIKYGTKLKMFKELAVYSVATNLSPASSPVHMCLTNGCKYKFKRKCVTQNTLFPLLKKK